MRGCLVGLGKRKRGFTLLELLIAMVILVVGVVGVLLVIPLAQRTANRSALMSRATIVASETIEELKAKGYEALKNQSTWSGSSDLFEWEATIEEVTDA